MYTSIAKQSTGEIDKFGTCLAAEKEKQSDQALKIQEEECYVAEEYVETTATSIFSTPSKNISTTKTRVIFHIIFTLPTKQSGQP